MLRMIKGKTKALNVNENYQVRRNTFGIPKASECYPNLKVAKVAFLLQ